MSLSGALSSAISALNAQSSALAMLSDNISNASTVGYKTTSAIVRVAGHGFIECVSLFVRRRDDARKVQYHDTGLVDAYFDIDRHRHQGNGFFPVTTSLTGGSTLYTRNGRFRKTTTAFSSTTVRTCWAGGPTQPATSSAAPRQQLAADRYQRRTDERQRDNDDNVLGQPAGRRRGWRHLHDVNVGV